ncbi:hypothetical protein FO519_003467 [Halicephalobus sp. NKZ332]|nr:hypothetical protein FO519_003467 [Halicephalobus sp. NKZ332]
MAGAVFAAQYGNYVAAILAFFSSVCAGFLLYLHISYYKKWFHEWSPQKITVVIVVNWILCALGITGMVICLVVAGIRHQSLSKEDLKGTNLWICAVWCWMTFKWTMMSAIYTRKYGKEVWPSIFRTESRESGLSYGKRFENENSKLDLKEAEWVDEESLIELTKKAKDEIDYLRAMVLGNAEIDPVIEKKKDLILGSIFSQPPSSPLYCHLDLPGGSYSTVEAVLRPIWQRGWDPRFSFYNSYLITCGIAEQSQIPISVFLSYSKCPKIVPNSIKIQKINKENAADFPKIGVCLKGLDFLDEKNEELMEWIEFQLLMGADKIRIYVYSIPEKTEKLLEYYKKKSKVEIVKVGLPVRNVYKLGVFDQGDSEVRILRINKRSSYIDPKSVSEKSFISTKTVATVFNHFALHRLHAAAARTLHLDPEISLKLHYKDSCPDELGLDCSKVTSRPILDSSLDRFADELELRIKEVKKELS